MERRSYRNRTVVGQGEGEREGWRDGQTEGGTEEGRGERERERELITYMYMCIVGSIISLLNCV